MSNRPRTRGEVGVAVPRTIQSDPKPHPEPEVLFDWAPKSVVMVINIGDNSYPYPDQPVERWTSTNQELTFTADVRPPIGDFITAYEWDFGDGNKGYGLAVTHTYVTASPSTRVVLRVTDNHGRKFSMGRNLSLKPAQVTLLPSNVIAQPEV